LNCGEWKRTNSSRRAAPLLSPLPRRRPPEIPRQIGHGVGQGGPGGDVLVDLLGIDLVDRVVRRVVPVEVGGGVLVEVEERDPGGAQGGDVGAAVGLVVAGCDPEGGEEAGELGDLGASPSNRPSRTEGVLTHDSAEDPTYGRA
jgi:hypothetical protein